jgi:hypothetical protein
MDSHCVGENLGDVRNCVISDYPSFLCAAVGGIIEELINICVFLGKLWHFVFKL